LQFTVADLQRREAYCSKEVLKGKARCTEDYPINEKQIERNFVNFPARHQGHMQKSTLFDKGTLRTSPSGIGTNVSTDCMPLAGGKFIQLFIDRFSGFAIGHFTVTTGDSKTSTECALKVVQEYKPHGHTVANISKDSLKAYQTNEFDSKFT
jgi:hypothetical protein